MGIFRKWKIDRLIKNRVLPKLNQIGPGDEEFIVDEKDLRIKIAVTEKGRRTFTIHQKSKDGKSWCYTTYLIDVGNDAPPFPLRSGSYPGQWTRNEK